VQSIQFARVPLSDGKFSLKVLAALEAGGAIAALQGKTTLVEN